MPVSSGLDRQTACELETDPVERDHGKFRSEVLLERRIRGADDNVVNQHSRPAVGADLDVRDGTWHVALAFLDRVFASD